MNNQINSYFHKCLFIFSILLLLSGCDIIDEIFGSGDDDNINGNESGSIEKIEVGIYIDNANYKYTYEDPDTHDTHDEYVNGGEFSVDFITVAGISGFADDTYITEFDNPSFLG